MTKTNYLLCPGDVCPLRFTCMRWQKWLSNDDDDESDEMDPDYHDGGCTKFIAKEYYGG